MATTAVIGSAATAAPVFASVGTDAGSRERAFAQASEEYGVPQVVLEGVSYAQTRWDFRPGRSTSGGYGPMHLVDASLGQRDALRGLGVDTGTSTSASTSASASTTATAPAADTLGRAATLIGVAREDLRTDELANIRGGGGAARGDPRRRVVTRSRRRP